MILVLFLWIVLKMQMLEFIMKIYSNSFLFIFFLFFGFYFVDWFFKKHFSILHWKNSCQWGLISRQGWAVVDDASGNQFGWDQNDWWQSPNVDQVDLYFFGKNAFFSNFFFGFCCVCFTVIKQYFEKVMDWITNKLCLIINWLAVKLLWYLVMLTAFGLFIIFQFEIRFFFHRKKRKPTTTSYHLIFKGGQDGMISMLMVLNKLFKIINNVQFLWMYLFWIW